MRISDWSSDVCSSDLRPLAAARAGHPRLCAQLARSAAPLRAAARLRPGRAAGEAEPDPQRAPRDRPADLHLRRGRRSEEHTSELQSLMRISYAVLCLKKQKIITQEKTNNYYNYKD